MLTMRFDYQTITRISWNTFKILKYAKILKIYKVLKNDQIFFLSDIIY